MASGPVSSPDRLGPWLAQALGTDGVVLRTIAGGNSKRVAIATPTPAWSNDPRQWLVRTELVHDAARPEPLLHEASVYRALARTQVCAPRVHAVSADFTVLVTDVLEGESDLDPVPTAQRSALLADLLDKLAALHEAPLGTMASEGLLLGEPVPSTLDQAVLAELDRWEEAMRTSPQAPTPLLELGARWLRENVLPTSQQPRLVHGDAGPGNFLFRGDRVTGLIDWELAHVGDPVEDLAWLLVRASLSGYDETAGLVRDHLESHWPGGTGRERLRYHLVLVLWKLQVIRHRMVGDADRNLGKNLFYRLLHQWMFVQAMSDALGRPVPEDVGDHWRPTERSWLFDAAVRQIKTLAIPATSGEAQAQVAGLVRVLRYLKVWEAQPPESASAEALATQIRTGEADLGDAFQTLATHVSTEHALCGELLGDGARRGLLRPAH